MFKAYFMVAKKQFIDSQENYLIECNYLSDTDLLHVGIPVAKIDNQINRKDTKEVVTARP
jgi:hypothetical protein